MADERPEERKYHHRPDEGETGAPDPSEGEEPHHRINEPADRQPPRRGRKSSGAQGMSQPRARGERVAGEPVPDPGES